MHRILPPVLFLASFAALLLLWLYHPVGLSIRMERTLPWEFPLLAGLGLLVIARWQFVKSDAQINTFKTPHKLVTEGLFRISRNPMYLGFTLLLTAAALFVNFWCALLAPFAFFLICNFWYIPFEEQNMRTVFGKSYDDYAWRVRRWI